MLALFEAVFHLGFRPVLEHHYLALGIIRKRAEFDTFCVDPVPVPYPTLVMLEVHNMDVTAVITRDVFEAVERLRGR